MAILTRTERAMVMSMCGVNLVDRKNMEELMEMLGLKEMLDGMAKANGVRWYGHVIRREDDNILKKAMMLEVNGQRKQGRPKMTWRRQLEESVKKVGLKIEEAADRTRWRRCESDCGRDEVYPATFSDEEKNEMKLEMMMMTLLSHFR